MGILKGFDQVSNILIQNPSKVCYSKENGVKQIKYYGHSTDESQTSGKSEKKSKNFIKVIRGSDVCCVGLLDQKHSLSLEEHLDLEYYFQKKDLSNIKVEGISEFKM